MRTHSCTDHRRSGNATVPVRGETSDNIFYRFHLRATDSAGETTEVTRDVLPQKSQVTLATQPAGLSLTLDGQPVTGPHTFTGVVGIERDLGAANQSFNCRNYQFSTWNPGGGAPRGRSARQRPTPPTRRHSSTADRPATPPTVALTAPANNSSGTVGTPITLTATAADSDGTIASVRFFDGTTAIGAADTSAPYSVNWTPSAAGAHTLTARATDSCGVAATSAAVTVTISTATGDTQPPTVAFTAPAALADGLTGSLQITANATDNVGVANVEFQVDGVTVATDTASPYAHRWTPRVRIRASTCCACGPATTPATVGVDHRAPCASAVRVRQRAASRATKLVNRAVVGHRVYAAARWSPADRAAKRHVARAAEQRHCDRHDAHASRGFAGRTRLARRDAAPDLREQRLHLHLLHHHAGGTHNRISRFTVSGNTASGEVQIANLPALSGATNHNGGALHFGTDGKLYVAVGDNANGRKAPILNVPFGKMLRFNDDGRFRTTTRSAPPPATSNCAIWARGLRNPFTFAVRASDGRIHINDVGERHLGRDQPRRRRRELRLAIDRRPDQRERRSPDRCSPSTTNSRRRQHRGLLQRVLDHRRRVLSRHAARSRRPTAAATTSPTSAHR